MRDHRMPELPPTPLGFKVWMVFCGVLGLGVLGLAAWAVIKLVTWVTSQ